MDLRSKVRWNGRVEIEYELTLGTFLQLLKSVDSYWAANFGDATTLIKHINTI